MKDWLFESYLRIRMYSFWNRNTQLDWPKIFIKEVERHAKVLAALRKYGHKTDDECVLNCKEFVCERFLHYYGNCLQRGL